MTDFAELRDRGLEIRDKYAGVERERYGRELAPAELALGLAGDIGDLGRLVMTHEAMRGHGLSEAQLHGRLDRKFGDALLSLIVLARLTGTDLEAAFKTRMDQHQARTAEEGQV